MPQLDVSFFGSFQAQLDGIRLSNFRSVNTLGLFAYLILQAERPFARDTLATLFWPDVPDSAAKKNLRQTLYQEPWREAAHPQLMRALALAGNRSAALVQFELCQQVLDEELGTPPERETVNLTAQIEAGAFRQEDSSASLRTEMLPTSEPQRKDALLETIFNNYVQQMVRELAATSPFDWQQARQWLVWLAKKSSEQSQSVFLLESLQPSWLQKRPLRW